MNLSPHKRAFIAGTMILTATGFLSRILGFFYRIFLSRAIGAEGLGIYNMVHPIFGICFALCAGSIQTAISRFVAAEVGKGRNVFRTGLVISLSMSLALTAVIWNGADFLAARVLLEPRCAPLLPMMALAVPCSAVHACINGYYYGLRKTKVPAFTQLMEQAVRIGAVFLVADIMVEKGIPITVQLAVFGHLIGEAASTLFSMVAFSLFPPDGIQPSAGPEPRKAVFYRLEPLLPRQQVVKRTHTEPMMQGKAPPFPVFAPLPPVSAQPPPPSWPWLSPLWETAWC